jgi:hypothetical protein
MNLLPRPSLPLFPILCCIFVRIVGAQQPPEPGTVTPPPPDKRVLGVLPNYRTANFTADYHPINARHKMTIALKDSFDYPLVGIGAIYASFYHLEDSHPQFGEGFKGYLRRFSTSYSDQVIGNMLTEGVLPVAFHEDPRYFRIGEGTKRHRAVYALTRILVTRTDSGGKSFNFAEVVGNGSATLIGWSYYTDSRNPEDYFQAFGTALATDAISQVLKEFWPDIKHRYFNHQKAVATD